MKHLSFVVLFITLFTHPIAASDDKARALVHSLSYIASDYDHAVENNVIVDVEEFEEMLEFSENVQRFYGDFSASLSASDTTNLGPKIRQLSALILNKADAKQVAENATFLKQEFIRLGKVSTAPKTYPDILNGAKIYKAACSRCHGENGYGDGKDGIGAMPAPRNFFEDEKMKTLSPFDAFNTVRLGITGTIMAPHPELNDKEVWDVAFYVLSLRHRSTPKSEVDKAISLEAIASLSDVELAEKQALTINQIAKLRLEEPSQSTHVFLNVATQHLNKALEAYQNADYSKAAALAASAYLEGIEAVELPLKNTNPELAEQLEKQMLLVRALIKKQAPESELEDAVDEAKKFIAEAENVLGRKKYSFLMAFWMTIAIVLREGLEAFLVIMAILAILNKADLRHRKKYVHIGWLSALSTGVVMWFLSGKLLTIGFANIEILEGIIALTAVAMLLYIGFWLHGKSNAESWKKYVGGLVKTANENGSGWGLAAVSFFVVFREVFESVLFLTALNAESKGTQGLAIFSGFLVALIAVLLLAVVALRFSAKLPITQLFRISSWMMSALAVVLTGKGIKAFQETGLLSTSQLPLPKFEVLGFFPTVETIAAQAISLLITVLLIRFASGKK